MTCQDLRDLAIQEYRKKGNEEKITLVKEAYKALKDKIPLLKMVSPADGFFYIEICGEHFGARKNISTLGNCYYYLMDKTHRFAICDLNSLGYYYVMKESEIKELEVQNVPWYKKFFGLD